LLKAVCYGGDMTKRTNRPDLTTHLSKLQPPSEKLQPFVRALRSDKRTKSVAKDLMK
jgi:hypothetical protein